MTHPIEAVWRLEATRLTAALVRAGGPMFQHIRRTGVTKEPLVISSKLPPTNGSFWPIAD